MLREDVHDRLGPLLAGIGLGLGARTATIRTDPDVAERQLLELRAQMRDAVAEVRRIVDGLAPLALERGDLAGALQAFAHCNGHGPRIRVHAADRMIALPRPVAAAAYAIALEATANAIRHADATRVDVRLRREPGALELTVADDGRGIPEAVFHGVGLLSMRARAQRLRGAVIVRSHPAGGTRIHARLPLA